MAGPLGVQSEEGVAHLPPRARTRLCRPELAVEHLERPLQLLVELDLQDHVRKKSIWQTKMETAFDGSKDLLKIGKAATPFQMDGRGVFLGFPQIARDEDLIDKLDKWAKLNRRYGGGMDLPTPIAQLLRIRPMQWKSKILDNAELQTPDKAISHTQTHMTWHRSGKLSAARAGQSEMSIASVNTADGPYKERMAKMNQMCAPITQNLAASPEHHPRENLPLDDRCWHRRKSQQQEQHCK